MTKPRVLLTTDDYRIVQEGHSRWGSNIERSDGYDEMGVRRWRKLTTEEWTAGYSRITRQIGTKLGKLRDARRSRKR